MSAKQASSDAKASPKAATKAKSKTAAKPKSRLAGPKPPKARAASSKAKTVSKAATTANVAKKDASGASTSKIPAPDMTKKPQAGGPVAVTGELKKRELIDLVVAKSDVKKKFAKPVVEALLEVIGEALANGRELNLQPLGKVKYNRTKETATTRVVVAKIRQSKAAKSPTTQVTDTSE